ncbi:MAG: hypothetical protein WAL98_12175 [Desulfatiglandaceae bacterium]|jgi:hypothetical protein
MNSGMKKLILFSLMLVSISLSISTVAFTQSTGEEIMTITGGVTNIKGMVLTLDKSNIFYPAIEVDVPDWAIVGSKASLSYYVKNYKNYYYEIVKPGEKFKVKETLEREEKELN